MAKTKRVADWLEKVSVAAIAVGLFQGEMILWGVVTAAILLGLSLALTKKEEGQK